MASHIQHYRTTSLKMAIWLIQRGCKLARLTTIKNAEDSRKTALEYAIQSDRRKVDLASLIRQYRKTKSRLRFKAISGLSFKDQERRQMKFLLRNTSEDFKAYL
jgi:hypothetical protein